MRISLFATVYLLFTLGQMSGADFDQLRGDRVGWARLQTTSNSWFRHATGDPVLMRFLRENTTLNIDPTWYAADVNDLSEMCKFPLLFSQGVQMVQDEKGRNNLAEYMRRGGFLFIDSCINKEITPSPDVFLAQHIALLSQIMPEAKVVPLPSTHDIYSIYFKIPNGKPPHTYHGNIYDERWHKHGLYAIQVGTRTVGLISLSGLQCGWDRVIAPPNHDIACMRLVVNIYVYAMIQGG